MRDIEGIEKTIEKLQPHWKEITEHFKKENSYFKSLLSQSHDSIGRVLKCHLMIEHYMDRFLCEHLDIDDLSKAKLSFFNKANLLPNKASAAAFVKPGILNLNSIRNKFSHRLNYTLNESDLPHVYQILRISAEGVACSEPLDAIEAFTTLACTFLIISPTPLQELFMEAFSEVRVNIRD